jgi:copper(I)-binding protein
MRLIKELAFAIALTGASLVSAVTGHAADVTVGNLTISAPWSRQSPMAGSVAAGFMTITNAGTEDDRLVKATAAISPNVQIHDMKMEGDVMKMVELAEGIVIPAGGTVELKPRSLHVMFLELPAMPKEGETFTGTLVFEKAGTVEITYEVKGPMAGMDH